jgi:ribulose-phosphate 3-epimerase
MTVNPGWGGQRSWRRRRPRSSGLRALVGPDPALEVDGGIDEVTAGPCRAAGADVFVAGTSVFGAEDPASAYKAVAAASRI